MAQFLQSEDTYIRTTQMILYLLKAKQTHVKALG